MKIKLFIFCFLGLIPALMFGQADDKINQFNSDGNRNGLWIQRYENGRVRYQGTFLNGKEVGVFYFWENKIHNNYPSIKKTFNLSNNYADVVFYFDDGIIRCEGKMLEKQKVGLWKYYDKQGFLVMDENYGDGKLNGVTHVYYPDGTLTQKSDYKNGVLDGWVERYSKEGVKLHQLFYKNGRMYGRATFYESNGVIKESGLYYKDQKVGKWDYYSKGEYIGYKDMLTNDEETVEQELAKGTVILNENKRKIYNHEEDMEMAEKLGVIVDQKEALRLKNKALEKERRAQELKNKAVKK